MLSCSYRVAQHSALMARKRLIETLRVRAPRGLRTELQRIADRRFLSVSDITREALRDYVAKQPMEKKAEVPA